jgi:hypothetical protein
MICKKWFFMYIPENMVKFIYEILCKKKKS